MAVHRRFHSEIDFQKLGTEARKRGNGTAFFCPQCDALLKDGITEDAHFGAICTCEACDAEWRLTVQGERWDVALGRVKREEHRGRRVTCPVCQTNLYDRGVDGLTVEPPVI